MSVSSDSTSDSDFRYLDFELSIVLPILSIDADYVTDPFKRRAPPLQKIRRRDGGSGCFETMRRYQDSMRISLLHETFQDLGKKFDERDQQHCKILMQPINEPRRGKLYWTIKCSVDMEQIDRLSQSMPHDRTAHFFVHDTTFGLIRGTSKGAVLAYISLSFAKHREKKIELILKIHRDQAVGTFVDNLQRFEFESFGNVVSFERQLEAVKHLRHVPFAPCVVNPSEEVVRRPIPVPAEVASVGVFQSFNETQKETIYSVVTMVMDKDPKPKLAMVQGPPGTGKTHMTTGILQLLVAAGIHREGAILVCAPSNAAVDQLLLRIMDEPWTMALSLVRVGREEKMMEEVKEFRPTGETRGKVLQQIVDADILFTTLNSSGSFIVRSAKELGKTYSCLIVDEVCQSVEPDFLIPIVNYEFSRVVAVGDHLQLPPTVLSREAKSLYYQRSFVERYQDYFFSHGLEDELMMLNVQYRMHPAICSFPNEHVYEGRIQTDTSVFNRYKGSVTPFPLRPYVVFNLKGTAEERENENGKHPFSCFNTREAVFVVHLFIQIIQAVPDRSIGIVTPYRAQKAIIKALLKTLRVNDDGFIVKKDGIFGRIDPKRLFDKNKNIVCKSFTAAVDRLKTIKGKKKGKQKCWLNDFVTVKTVDSYQGGEKDVVVFSCVRASPEDLENEDFDIGFVRNRQRMNVALTRAREALCVVGAFDTLESADENWNALGEDARQRRKFVDGVGRVAETIEGMKEEVVERIKAAVRKEGELIVKCDDDDDEDDDDVEDDDDDDDYSD